MTRRKRRNHSPVFQAMVRRVLNELPPESEAPVIELETADNQFADMYLGFPATDLDPNQITDWKTQLMERSAQVFGDAAAKAIEPDIKTMQAKIGELTLENDFLESALTKAGLLSARK